jgi:TonB family protein
MLLRLTSRFPLPSLRRPALAVLATLTLFGSAALAQVIQPRPLATPAAEYPAALRKSLRAGQAVLQVTVSKTGVVVAAEVKSADDPAFGEAALAAVQQWTFTPATRDGVPSASSIDVPFVFTVPIEEQVNASVGREVFKEFDQPIIESSLLRVRPTPNKPVVPVYPKELIGSGKSAEYKINFIVTREGQVINPSIPPEGPDALRVAALVAIARAEFTPVFHQGLAVNCRTSAVVRLREPKVTPPPKRTQPAPVSERVKRDDT